MPGTVTYLPYMAVTKHGDYLNVLVYYITLNYKQCFGSGSGFDTDAGGQKRPTKIVKSKKFHVLKCWMFSFEG
jgi:hypothetical protein